MKNDKTNVMRVLDSKKVAYQSYSYTADSTLSGEQIAELLNEDVKRVFKTLVTQGKTGQHYVFVIPVAEELDLKKAAKACGEKSVAMIKQKELLPLTGYIHGGCSPIGMKKMFSTFVHISAKEYDKMFVSAGKVGMQVELPPQALIDIVNVKFDDLIVET
ncbi:Cys-tRNA(Pro)/Cys-tRNA(Cys) deacylase [Eubacterium ruminantium]|nr:Cys-tRNA(Pro)/Cys-tRNA(Cys) deacylase [Eubacterium ruminantium]